MVKAAVRGMSVEAAWANPMMPTLLAAMRAASISMDWPGRASLFDLRRRKK